MVTAEPPEEVLKLGTPIQAFHIDTAPLIAVVSGRRPHPIEYSRISLPVPPVPVNGAQGRGPERVA
jgi:hypothetical protein